MDFWVPPKPAIIIPASKESMKSILPANMIVGAGQSVPLTISFFNSSVSQGTPGALVLPSSINAGDLIYVVNSGRNNVGAAADADLSGSGGGFTTILNIVTLANTRVRAWYKIAAGTEGGTGPGGLNGGVENDRLSMVFRCNRPIVSVAVSGLNTDQTDGNPNAQTLPAGNAPSVMIAGYRSSGAVSTRSFSPGSATEITPANTRMYGKYLINNSAPAGQTIDMADDGTSNTLFCFCLELG